MADDIQEKFKKSLDACEKREDVLNLKAGYLGKKGEIGKMLLNLKNADPKERQKIGMEANFLKKTIRELTDRKILELEKQQMDRKLSENKIDIGLLDSNRWRGDIHGGLHPVSVIRQQIEDVFISMGFSIIDGPHIEDEYHNFTALNIPENHPAREMQDTFWFDEKDDEKRWLLRTHTSPIQIREMKRTPPPFKFIAPGKVFRCERTDASHESVFHQIEGMMVDENISVSHLVYFMETLLSEIFQKKTDVRLRPGFFPFVEPGFELDMKCRICQGKGCSVCKYTGWVELIPCGMIHPNVLKEGGVSTKWNGFAFGLGLDRLVMMKYGIDDIRHMHQADLRFIRQFQSY